MLKSMRKNGVTLALFALGCTAMVVLTNELTRDRIAHQQQLEKLRTLEALLPAGSYDNNLVASCRLVTSREYLGSDQPMPLYTATLKGNTPAMRWKPWLPTATVVPFAWWSAQTPAAPSAQCGCWLTRKPRVLATTEELEIELDRELRRQVPHQGERGKLGGEEGWRRI